MALWKKNGTKKKKKKTKKGGHKDSVAMATDDTKVLDKKKLVKVPHRTKKTQ